MKRKFEMEMFDELDEQTEEKEKISEKKRKIQILY
jgi:hypothetical protein